MQVSISSTSDYLRTNGKMSFAGITVLAVVAMAGMVMGESCYCTENYDPVCASNGQVFSNLCMMRCHNINKHDNLVVAERDVCSHHATNFMAIPKLNCFRSCPHTPLPVCGSDGQTYGSACALDCLKKIENEKADVTVVHTGYCHQATNFMALSTKNCFRTCPHTPLPVCGSDGQTYGSSCALDCLKKTENEKADVTVVHTGYCHQASNFMALSTKNCFRTCPHTPLPVCGSDGMTYGSACALDCLKKTKNEKADVTIVHTGYCL